MHEEGGRTGMDFRGMFDPETNTQGELQMSRTILQRLFPFTDSDNWSTEKWRRHLLSHATSQLEKDDINAMFRRDA